MDTKHSMMLRHFVRRFGLPDLGDSMSIYVKDKDIPRRLYPPGVALFNEDDLLFLYQMEKEGLIDVKDYRRGTHFDGPCGLSPGWAPGDPTDSISIVFTSDEASAWLDQERRK